MKITEHRQSHKTRYFLLAASLLLAIGAWVFYQSYIQKPSPVNPIPEIIESLPELALPLSERVENSLVISERLDIPKTSVPLPANELNNNEGMAPAAQEQLVGAESEAALVEATAAVESTGVVAEDVVEEAVAAGKTRLQFSATQETWLSVINASGKEVYNKILYAGNQDVVDIWQPSLIVVGNAHGASLIVDGKPIDLAPYTRINVARVRLNR